MMGLGESGDDVNCGGGQYGNDTTGFEGGGKEKKKKKVEDDVVIEDVVGEEVVLQGKYSTSIPMERYPASRIAACGHSSVISYKRPSYKGRIPFPARADVLSEMHYFSSSSTFGADALLRF
jgi:hypothetical protein